MALFNKKSELEKNAEEISVVNGRIADAQSHMIDLTKIREGIELELTLGADSALEKRLKKLTAAEEKTKKDIAELQERLSQLHQAIADEEARQRKAQVAEAGKAHENAVFEAYRAIMIRQEMEKLLPMFDNVSGLVEPAELKRMAGLGYGESLDSSDEADLIAARNKAEEAGRERAEKEAQEVVSKLRKAIGL
ncbi:hypothetical protein M1K46_07980 [Fictibacillus sp. WQ 8-8]|uniref:hypothetical protein n=1 Tax=Fictibacillus sp. WQ 8-8 TaxID=2938788 RepID=UPI002109156E|nr:hypothetical protein [Fictibacillus sp. WQ 8-8]MCQ6265601.1 hypothetical protein [Fictibacillus sp. WQ 8-8]